MEISSKMNNDWSRYESIFEHYQLREAPEIHGHETETEQRKLHHSDFLLYDRREMERNESKSKTIDAKSVNKKSKSKKPQSKVSSETVRRADRSVFCLVQARKTGSGSVINIPVPPAAQSRKTNYT